VAAGTRSASIDITHQSGSLSVPVAGTTLVPVQDAKAAVTLAPDNAKRGETLTVNVTGDMTYFVQDATVADFGPGITVGGQLGAVPVTVASPTTASLAVKIENAAPGPRTIRVTTNGHSSAFTFNITSADNEPALLPVAVTGPEQKVEVGATVHLDAGRSYVRTSSPQAFASASDATPPPNLTFQWKLLSIPTNSTAVLSGDASMLTSFVADQAGNYVVQLTALNGTDSTVTSTTISTVGSSPEAEAGPNLHASLGTKAALNGSPSSSPDGDSLLYDWQVVSKPETSAASLVNTDSVAPIFIPDVEGTYLFRLTVSDDHGNRSSDVVNLSTSDLPPVANAGYDQTVATGSTVQLDGSSSIDADGDTLTYDWMFISMPSASTATLSDGQSKTPTFTADVAGDYQVQLVVSDSGGNASNPATVLISTEHVAPIAIAGESKKVVVGSDVTLDGSASSDPLHHNLTYQWTLISVPDNSTATLANANTAKPSFHVDMPGYYVAQLIVSCGTFQSPPSSAVFVAESPNISLDQTTLDFGKLPVATTSTTKTVTITSSGTADLIVTGISLSGTNPADFAFTSATLPVTLSPGKSTTVNLTFTPSASGSRAATLLVASNALGDPRQVALSGTGASAGASIDPTALDFGEQTLNSHTDKTVTVSNSGDANLIISSIGVSGANAAEFTVTPSTAPIDLAPGATQSFIITFTPTAEGARSATLTIDHNAPVHPGTVTLAGTGVKPVLNVTPTALTFAEQVANTTSQPQNLTLKNIGTGLLVVSSITITGDNASDFAYSATLPLNIAQGATATLPVTFTPQGSGPRNATLSISGSTSNVTLTGSATATGELRLLPVTLGQNLQTKAITVTTLAAVSQDTPVVVRSADASKLLLSLDPAQAGSASVTVTIAHGTAIASPGFYAQALGNSGTVQMAASAPGYSTGSTTVTLTPSALVVEAGSGIGGDFTTGTSKDSVLRISSHQLAADLSPGTEQDVRGGFNPTIVMTSAATTVGTIVGSPATFLGAHSYSEAISFHPIAAGDTILTLTQPSGFTQPKNGASLKATVTGPAIALQPVLVGSNLQVLGHGSLDVAPSSDLHVTLLSSNTTMILLSLSPGTLGTASVELVVPAGQTMLPTFYVQAVGASGTAQITASGGSYTAGTGNVTITPSALLLAGPEGINGSGFTTTSISPNSSLKLSVYRLDPLYNPIAAGQLRGGIQIQVTVKTDSSWVGSIVGSPATLVGGDTSNNVLQFHPTAAGAAQLAVQQPTGFSTPSSGGSLTVTVTSPQISINLPITDIGSTTSIGKDLQLQASGALNVAAPSGGLTVTFASDNPDVLLTASEAAVGTQSIQVQVPAGKGYQGVGFPPIWIQSRVPSGTATITASATGWTSGTATVLLAPSGFVLAGVNGIGQDIGAQLGQGDKTLTVLSYQLDPVTLLPNYAEEIRGLVAPLPVYLTSGTPGVGTITNSVMFSGGTRQQTVVFHPIAVGSTLLTVQTPNTFTAPAFGASLTAIVN
jgi:hypothetical protein